MRDLPYDIETYINLFSIVFYNPKKDTYKTFEMSPWHNDWAEFLMFTKNCSEGFIRWVGFNNYYFDYQVLHYMIINFSKGEYTGEELAYEAYKKANEIINTPKDQRFASVVWDNNHYVPQVDLYRIHHFDNIARATSLKVLEFNMRSETIEDLPFDPHTPLTEEQRPVILDYNKHDVKETYKFYLKTLDMIRFREELSKKYGKNFLNHNDTKIGKDYFIMELENAGISCYHYDDGERKPVQTKRPIIRLKDIIFPYVKFERPEFNAILGWLKKQNIRHTKAVFTELDDIDGLEDANMNMKLTKGKVKNLNCVIDGLQFDFGTGGIHGSVEPTIVSECEDYAILDYDVTSLYPSIAIVNECYPLHLKKKFCEIYGNMKTQRMSYEKGTPENAMLKLALNGVYGDSNNKFSPFYDPQYTMTITINGQLMLCMLAEMYMKINGLKIIQINTDGITVHVPRETIDEVERMNQEWMKITKLELERADYSDMFIRDVNNYIGVYTDGKLKRKGKYEYDIGWHQNHSSLVVQKAVEASLIGGFTIEEFIKNHDDVHDFMLRTKVPRTSRLLWGNEQVQNVSRYYISTEGRQFTKIMPPLKGKTEERHIAVNKGYDVTVINTMGKVENINYDWYIKEAYKLVNPLWDGVLSEMIT